MKQFLFITMALLITGCGLLDKEVKKYSIEQFYKNTRVAGGAFSADETKLLVSSDQSGIFNVYEIAIATGRKTQITLPKRNHFLLSIMFPAPMIFFTQPILVVTSWIIFIF
jgi:hypothetical protein